jgi:hypothetical protein
VIIESGASAASYFRDILEGYLRSTRRKTEKKALNEGLIYEDKEEFLCFKSTSLVSYLDNIKYKYVSIRSLFDDFKSCGGTTKRMSVEGKTTFVWCIKKEGELPNLDEEDEFI